MPRLTALPKTSLAYTGRMTACRGPSRKLANVATRIMDRISTLPRTNLNPSNNSAK